MSLKVWSPPAVQSSGTGIVVGDAYASALGVVPITIAGSKTKIDIKEAGLGGNGIYYKILAGTNSQVLCTDVAIAKGAIDYQILDGPWESVDVQLKNQTAGSAGTATVIVTRG
jgi:hypothetical protein